LPKKGLSFESVFKKADKSQWTEKQQKLWDKFWEVLESNEDSEMERVRSFLIDKKRRREENKTGIDLYDKQKSLLKGSFFNDNWIAPKYSDTNKDNISTNLAIVLEMIRDTAFFNPLLANMINNLFLAPRQPREGDKNNLSWPQRDIAQLNQNFICRFQTMAWIKTFVIHPLSKIRTIYEGKLQCERLTIELLRRLENSALRQRMMTDKENFNYDFSEWKDLLEYLKPKKRNRKGNDSINEVSRAEWKVKEKKKGSDKEELVEICSTSHIMSRLVSLATSAIFQDFLEVLARYGYDPELPDESIKPESIYYVVERYRSE